MFYRQCGKFVDNTKYWCMLCFGAFRLLFSFFFFTLSQIICCCCCAVVGSIANNRLKSDTKTKLNTYLKNLMDKNHKYRDTKKIMIRAIQEREKWKSVGLTLRHLNSIELWASQESLHLCVATTKPRKKLIYAHHTLTHKHEHEHHSTIHSTVDSHLLVISICARWTLLCFTFGMHALSACLCVFVCVRLTRQMEEWNTPTFWASGTPSDKGNIRIMILNQILCDPYANKINH